MKIGIDAREIQNGVITGIGRSLDNFIQYFCNHDKENDLLIFSEKKLGIDYGNGITQITLSKCKTILWDQLKLPKAIKSHNIDLFYSPYYKIPLLTTIPVVNQILDLMWLGFQPYKKSLGVSGRFYYAVFGKAFAKKSLSIITDSEHAKSDIIKFWNINPHKIEVIPLGLAHRYRPVQDIDILNKVKKKFKLPEKYIFYLGNFKPHKNVKALVKAFKIIEQKFFDYKLVLSGPIDVHGQMIKQYVSQLGLSDRVLFTNTIKSEDCPEALFSMADVFVFPTLYEGFGLPPLEAMACGTPVVASKITSIPEVVGDAGLLVKPMDIEGMSKTISDLLENREKRMIYSKKGLKRAERFREKDTAGKLYEHIISLL